MKKIVVLGSTGSIGENTLRVVESLPNEFEIIGLAANRSAGRLAEQARQFGVRRVAMTDPAAASELSGLVDRGTSVLSGMDGVCELAALAEADIVVCAVVGMAGLRPVMAAVEQGTDVAISTKEVLVAAGHVVTAACASSGARLLPVDSEHSALFQCLQGATHDEEGGGSAAGRRPIVDPGVTAHIDRLLLTASGGPFFRQPELDLASVTVADALNHPNWSMGPKVTVDSATLMNKGLEVIEARWLFDIPVEKIDVVVHPESIVHSMVQFVDGNVLAQLSPPDMRFAIQYALTWPRRLDSGLTPVDLFKAGSLHFVEPDHERFPCLGLAFEAARQGGTLAAVMNAANEVAVERFLKEEIGFPDVWRTVESVMHRHTNSKHPSLGDIFAADAWARAAATGI